MSRTGPGYLPRGEKDGRSEKYRMPDDIKLNTHMCVNMIHIYIYIFILTPISPAGRKWEVPGRKNTGDKNR